jgi:hypothetical protein
MNAAPKAPSPRPEVLRDPFGVLRSLRPGAVTS